MHYSNPLIKIEQQTIHVGRDGVDTWAGTLFGCNLADLLGYSQVIGQEALQRCLRVGTCGCCFIGSLAIRRFFGLSAALADVLGVLLMVH